MNVYLLYSLFSVTGWTRPVSTWDVHVNELKWPLEFFKKSFDWNTRASARQSHAKRSTSRKSVSDLKQESTSRRLGCCFKNRRKTQYSSTRSLNLTNPPATMRSNCIPGLSLVILVINVPCFSVGLKCYTCVSRNSWKECERSLKVTTCPAPVDEVCVKERLVEHDDNSEEGTKNTFSKFCATAEACKDKHCKEVGKLCDPKCCHTDLCNMAVTIRPSTVTFVFCLLLVNFVVQMMKN